MAVAVLVLIIIALVPRERPIAQAPVVPYTAPVRERVREPEFRGPPIREYKPNTYKQVGLLMGENVDTVGHRMRIITGGTIIRQRKATKCTPCQFQTATGIVRRISDATNFMGMKTSQFLGRAERTRRLFTGCPRRLRFRISLTMKYFDFADILIRLFLLITIILLVS